MPIHQMRRSSKNPSRSFADRVRHIVAAIKAGETRAYAEVARAAGNPKAARAVGVILRTNFDPKIPCHRVIRSDGTLGGYNRGVTQKRKLLLKEHAVF